MFLLLEFTIVLLGHHGQIQKDLLVCQLFCKRSPIWYTDAKIDIGTTHGSRFLMSLDFDFLVFGSSLILLTKNYIWILYLFCRLLIVLNIHPYLLKIIKFVFVIRWGSWGCFSHSFLGLWRGLILNWDQPPCGWRPSCHVSSITSTFCRFKTFIFSKTWLRSWVLDQTEYLIKMHYVYTSRCCQ